MPRLHNQATVRLLNAIEEFTKNPPRDLPDGAIDTLQDLGTSLNGYVGAPEASPGAKEAMKVAAGTDGTGEAFPKAAVGVDGPSPGQREYENANNGN